VKTVLIGIQARSTSTRLPRKAFATIGDRMLLDHVLKACKDSAFYLNNARRRTQLARVALLVPEGDPIAAAFRDRCYIVEGPEDDVLTRYAYAAQEFSAHYVVRITADCPKIPPYVISAHVARALAPGTPLDYLSNVDEDARTSPDGHDCEVISRRLLDHVHAEAKSAFDREHVTTFIRRGVRERTLSRDFRCKVTVGFTDDSAKKLSVDTEDDLRRVREDDDRVEAKIRRGLEIYGPEGVLRL